MFDGAKVMHFDRTILHFAYFLFVKNITNYHFVN